MAKSPEKQTDHSSEPDPNAPKTPGGGGLSWWQRIGRGGGEHKPFENAFQELEHGYALSVGEESRLIKKILAKGLEDEKLAVRFLNFAEGWMAKERWSRNPVIGQEILKAAAALGKKHDSAGLHYFPVLQKRIGATYDERNPGRIKDNLPHSEQSLGIYSDACDVAEQSEKTALTGFKFLKSEIERGKFTPDSGKKLLNTDAFRVQALERILLSLKTMALKYESLRGPLRDQAAELVINRTAEGPDALRLAFGTVLEASRGYEERGLSTIFRIHSAMKERGLSREEAELLADATGDLARPLIDTESLLALFNARSSTALLKRERVLQSLDETGILAGLTEKSLLEHFNAVQNLHKKISDLEKEIKGEEKKAQRDIKQIQKDGARQIECAKRESELAVEGAKGIARKEIEERRKRTEKQIMAVTAAKDQRVGDSEIETAEKIDENDKRIAEIDEEIRLLRAERAGLVDDNAKLKEGAESVRTALDIRLQNVTEWLNKREERDKAKITANEDHNIVSLHTETESETARLQHETDEKTQARDAQRQSNIDQLQETIKEMRRETKAGEPLARKIKANGQDGPIGIHPLDAIGVPHDGKPGLGQG